MDDSSADWKENRLVGWMVDHSADNWERMMAAQSVEWMAGEKGVRMVVLADGMEPARAVSSDFLLAAPLDEMTGWMMAAERGLLKVVPKVLVMVGMSDLQMVA